MDIWKYFDVTHRKHVLCNPMDVAKLDELLGLFDLPDGAAVVDIASGKGEVLVRLAERYPGLRGTGVDISPFFVEQARALAAARVPDAALEWPCMAGADWAPAAPASLDLAMCIGAEFVYGSLEATLDALCAMVRPGGLVLSGAPYWLQPPAPEYLAAEEMTATTFRDGHAANAKVGTDRGLELVYLLTSSPDDWDRYEGLQWNAVAEYAAAYPGDPDLPEIRRRSGKARDIYLRWGRDTLGWALYLFRKP
jgi:SAM-dependent methyltransferase